MDDMDLPPVNVTKQEFSGDFDMGLDIFTGSKPGSETSSVAPSMIPSKSVSIAASATPSEQDFGSFMKEEPTQSFEYDGQGMGDHLTDYAGSDVSPEESREQKQRMLDRIRRWEGAGMRCTVPVDMDSPMSEIRVQYQSMKRERSLKSGIQKIRGGITMTSNIIESFHKPIGGAVGMDLHLEGWANHLSYEMNIEHKEEYETIFEDLYEKYYEYLSFPPEVELAIKLVMSMFDYHAAIAAANKHAPGANLDRAGQKAVLKAVMQHDPQYAQQMANNRHEFLQQRIPQLGNVAPPNMMSARPMQTRQAMPKVSGLAPPSMEEFDMSKLMAEANDEIRSVTSIENGRRVTSLDL